MIPLVLVHGFMGGSGQWATLTQALRGAIDIVAVDLPGYGDNAEEPPLDSISAYAHWVVDALAARGIRRFHLLGHSMGGMITQEIVARYPQYVDRLVLYGTGVSGVLPGRFETIATSKQRAQADGARLTARRIAATWFLHGDASPAYARCADIAERCNLTTLLAGLDAMHLWPGLQQLDCIRAKTLVIWGDQDRTYPWAQTEALWRSVPQTSLAVLPGCAHAAHMEKPQLFNLCVADFLELDAARSAPEPVAVI